MPTTATATEIRGPGGAGAAADGGVRAGRLRARRAGGDPAGGPVPRRGRREPARAHLRVHRSGRRGAVPAPRPHRAHLPPASGAAPRRQRAGALLLSAARRSATSRRRRPRRIRASSARPASSCSPPPTASGRTPPCWCSPSRRLREAGSARACGCASAISACSPRCIDALPMPERWRRACRHQFWRARRRSAPSWRASPPTQARAGRALPDACSTRLDPADPARRPKRWWSTTSIKAGIELIGTRTAAEIAQRLLAEAADRARDAAAEPRRRR